jgi:hypothetical protein
MASTPAKHSLLSKGAIVNIGNSIFALINLDVNLMVIEVVGEFKFGGLWKWSVYIFRISGKGD